MSGSPEFLINKALYQWCVRALSVLASALNYGDRITVTVHLIIF
jgi:hypothetical protein